MAFFGPVRTGINYRQALQVEDYVRDFESRLNALRTGWTVFSCNCVLNYLQSNLEGRRAGSIAGPMTLGEVAFRLPNQALVYLMIEESRADDA